MAVDQGHDSGADGRFPAYNQFVTAMIKAVFLRTEDLNDDF